MKSTEYLVLKKRQFYGGILGIVVGAILALLGVSDPSKLSLGGGAWAINITSSIGGVISLIGLIVVWRSGGGVKFEITSQVSEASPGVKSKKESITLSPAGDRHVWQVSAASIRCPQCNRGIATDSVVLRCECRNCEHTWTQNVPSEFL